MIFGYQGGRGNYNTQHYTWVHNIQKTAPEKAQSVSRYMWDLSNDRQ